MSTTVSVSAADVNKLRQITGAGVMDCKQALIQAGGDFEKAIDELRKKGQKVAATRADRETREGYVTGRTNDQSTKGWLIAVSCETDFVAKSADFIQFAEAVIQAAVQNNPASIEELKSLSMEGVTISDKLMDLMAKIGEKIDITFYRFIQAPRVAVYVHPGNKIASMVGLNIAGETEEGGKNIAMQVAAMNPIAIDRDDVDPKLLERELAIAREQARAEGKPENILDKIAQGKLNKFFQESTLLNQTYIKDEKKTVRQYLESVHKGLTVTGFHRIQLG
jgi:elongation factor Ts